MKHARLLIGPVFIASLTVGCKGKEAPVAPELSLPAKLTLVSGDGQSTTAPGGTPLAPLIVRVTDPKNRPVSGVAVAWAASDASARLSAATSTTDADGQAQATWTLAETTGAQSVTATTATIPGARVVFQAKIAVSSLSGTVAVGTALPLAFSANRIASSAPSISYTHDVASLERALATRAPSRRLIVQFKPMLVGASRAIAIARPEIARNQSAMQRTLGAYIGRSVVTNAELSPAILAARVTVPDGADVRAAIETLAGDPTIESVTVDEIIPMLGDYTATEATPLRAPADASIGSTRASAALTLSNDPLLLNEYWHYNLVDAFRVWGANTGSTQVLVAVVDQGVRFDHPAMASNFTTDGYNFVAGGNRLAAPQPVCASSGGGTTQLGEVGPGPDATLPDDFLGVTTTGCWVRETAGDHGLHVSGTIGAPGNDGIGTSGLNWKVQIRPVRVLDVTGSGSNFDVAQGILYAAGLPAPGAGGAMVQVSPGARVINMSLGSSVDNQVVRSAVLAATEAGSLIVASAGNSATYSPSYPASYPQVLSVAALGPDLQLSSYSNLGANISLSAPGGDFRLCCGGGGGIVSTTYNFVTRTGNYAYYTGTSMAAPHVTGVAALVLATNPSMTNTQLRQRLQSTAVDIGQPGRDDRYGYGVVNAYNAVNNITSVSRGSFVRIINASTGDVFRSIPASNGSYSVSSVPAGNYYVVAGEDDTNDQAIGIPGRRLGWFGGAAAAPVAVAAGQAATASVLVGTPFASKPNGNFTSATRLFVNAYAIDFTTSVDPVAAYVVQIPKAATYFFETSGVLGTCGLGPELDTVLELYDQTQALRARNDNAAFAGSALCSQISVPLTPGTYYLRVTPSTAATAGTNAGQFRIAVREAP